MEVKIEWGLLKMSKKRREKKETPFGEQNYFSKDLGTNATEQVFLWRNHLLYNTDEVHVSRMKYPLYLGLLRRVSINMAYGWLAII